MMRERSRQGILAIVQGLLMGAALIAGRYALQDLFPATNKEVTSPAAIDEAAVERFMDAAAQMSPDLAVTRQPLSIIERNQRERPLTYLVEAKKTNEYWFTVADYRLHTAGDWDAVDPKTLAVAIDRAYLKRTSFPAELAASVGVSASRGPISGEITLSFPVRLVAEMLGLIKGVVQLDVERIEIAIKGYADGEASPEWRPPVSQLPAAYSEFPVLPPVDQDKVNWTFYREEEYLRTLSFPYANADFPDLRAQFIRKEFVEEVVRNTVNARHCKIYVLHNKPLLPAERAEYRKAQVYVMIYLKAPK